MIITIQIIITTLFVGSAQYIAYITKNLSPIWTIIVVPIITAILVIITNSSINQVIKNLSKPSLTIQTLNKSGEINFNIKIEKGTIEQISLDYPIIGTITHFQDLNLITDARAVVMGAIGGSTQNDVQNNLQLSIADIRTGSILEYKIFYKKPSENIFINGTDRYKLVYTWKYDGEKVQETEWHLIQNDQLTDPPDVTVIGTRIFNKALTEEEIRKSYEQGLIKRDF